MELEIGDVVEFKKYEDLSFDETVLISKDEFPQSGKVRKIIFGNEKVIYFFIEGSQYSFSAKSVARVISAVDGLKPGDEVLVKATVKEVFDDFMQINPSVEKTDVVDVLKRKEEHFIVREDHYGMYVNGSEVLVVNKDDAKIYNSRNEANEVAAYMHLNAWDVIPYDA